MTLYEFMKAVDNGNGYGFMINYYFDIFSRRNPATGLIDTSGKIRWLTVEKDEEYSFEGSLAEFENMLREYDVYADLEINDPIITKIVIDNKARHVTVDIHVETAE